MRELCRVFFGQHRAPTSTYVVRFYARAFEHVTLRSMRLDALQKPHAMHGYLVHGSLRRARFIRAGCGEATNVISSYINTARSVPVTPPGRGSSKPRRPTVARRANIAAWQARIDLRPADSATHSSESWMRDSHCSMAPRSGLSTTHRPCSDCAGSLASKPCRPTSARSAPIGSSTACCTEPCGAYWFGFSSGAGIRTHRLPGQFSQAHSSGSSWDTTRRAGCAVASRNLSCPHGTHSRSDGAIRIAESRRW